ncbi:UNVERIFIED_CONTAM: Pa2g4 [Trichonephila clavipes]
MNRGLKDPISRKSIFFQSAFTMSFEDEKKARMGVVECVNHKLIEPFTVLYEKEGEYVAQFKFTVLLMPSGSHKITSGPIDLEMYETTKQIEDESLKVKIYEFFSPSVSYN